MRWCGYQERKALWFSALETFLNFDLNSRRDVTVSKTLFKKSMTGHGKATMTSH